MWQVQNSVLEKLLELMSVLPPLVPDGENYILHYEKLWVHGSIISFHRKKYHSVSQNELYKLLIKFIKIYLICLI